MKTAKEKAEYWLNDNVAGWAGDQLSSLTALIKEQDRDTRHACAEAIAAMTGDSDINHIDAGAAHNACINIKAV